MIFDGTNLVHLSLWEEQIVHQPFVQYKSFDDRFDITYIYWNPNEFLDVNESIVR